MIEPSPRWISAVVLFFAVTTTALAKHPAITLRDQEGKNVIDSGRPVSTMKSCSHCHDTQYIATHSYHVSSTGGDADPHAHALDPASGSPQRANWQESGAVEMNCFLCHMPNPDNQARLKELRQGRSQWANTATLAATGLTEPTQDGWTYRREAFSPDGRLDASKLAIRQSRSGNCGLCHGLTHDGEEPLKLDLSLRQWSTATQGQVFSPQRISESAVDLVDKEHLARPWDVHAERLLECASCHYSLNDPALYEPTPRHSLAGRRPAHLNFEPRRLAIGDYIERPSHQFAKGQTSQGSLATDLDGTMRGCDDCHNAAETHDWLPYQQAHFARLSCEACHIAQVYAPAVRQVDWALPTPTGEPRIEWRGIEGNPRDPTARVVGFRPTLLPEEDLDGRTRLVPHNLISIWYWVEGGATPRPVRLADLKTAVLHDGKYRPDIAAALAIGNREQSMRGAAPKGTVPGCVLDTPQKVEAVRRRLEAVGVVQPHIVAEVQPYSLHHGVGPAKWATRKCKTCHAGDSRLSEGFALASYVPGGKLPELVDGTALSGQLRVAPGGELIYLPSTRQASLYVLGHSRWLWVNALGGLSLMAAVVSVVIHAGLRLWSSRPQAKSGIIAPLQSEGSIGQEPSQS